MTERAARITVALGFVASRVAFHLAGVRYDTSPLPWFWQYLDPPLLFDDLARSLWFLHAQPPLFNAYLGGVLKIATGHAAQLFHGIALAIGLGIALALRDLLERIGLGRVAAIAVTLVYVASPTAVLYEKWLMYTHFETGALVLAAWALFRLCDRGGWVNAALYFGAIAALAMTRSLFHPLWVAACAAIPLVATRPLRREAVVGGVCALMLVGGFHAKNASLFGTPAASSWFGMNLANMIFEGWPHAEREQLVEQGVLSPLALIRPFSPLDVYPESFRSKDLPDVPALRAPSKRSGEANYNHIDYIAISQGYRNDAATLIRREPARYAALVASAWKKFLVSPSNYVFVAPNRRHILAWNRLYDAVLYGVPSAWSGDDAKVNATIAPASATRIGWLWIALCVPAMGLAVLTIARAPFGSKREAPARVATLAFCVGTIAFVSVAANAVELGENNRFRAPIEPLLIVVVAHAAAALAPRWKKELPAA